MKPITEVIADGVAAREEVMDTVGSAAATLPAARLLADAQSGDDVVDALLHAALAVSAAHLQPACKVARESVQAEVAVVRAADPRTLVAVGDADITAARERRKGERR